MAIFIQCACGKDYSVPENRAGKRFKCYLCNRELEAAASDQSSEERISPIPETSPGAALASGSSEEDAPGLAALMRQRQKLQETRKCRANLGLISMLIGGGIHCLGWFTWLAEGSGNPYSNSLGLIVLGALIFLLGFRQWFRWWG